MNISTNLKMSESLSRKIVANIRNKERFEIAEPDSIWFLTTKWRGLLGCRGVILTDKSVHILSTGRNLIIKNLRSVPLKDITYIRCEFGGRSKLTFSCLRMELGQDQKKPLVCLVFNAEDRVEESSSKLLYRYSQQQIDTIKNLLLMLQTCQPGRVASTENDDVFAKVLDIIDNIGTVPGQPSDRRIFFSAMGAAFSRVLREGESHLAWDDFTLQIDRQIRKTLTKLSELFRRGIEHSKSTGQMQHEINSLVWLEDAIKARQLLWLTICEGRQGVRSRPIPAEKMLLRLSKCRHEVYEQESVDKPMTVMKVLSPTRIGNNLGALASGNLPTKGFFARSTWSTVVREIDSVLGMLPEEEGGHISN